MRILLLRVATIRHSADTHYRHIPFLFSHNKFTPVQISLQYLHAGFSILYKGMNAITSLYIPRHGYQIFLHRQGHF